MVTLAVEPCREPPALLLIAPTQLKRDGVAAVEHGRPVRRPVGRAKDPLRHVHRVAALVGRNECERLLAAEHLDVVLQRLQEELAVVVAASVRLAGIKPRRCDVGVAVVLRQVQRAAGGEVAGARGDLDDDESDEGEEDGREELDREPPLVALRGLHALRDERLELPRRGRRACRKRLRGRDGAHLLPVVRLLLPPRWGLRR